jgi:hypothetical protein
MLLIKKLLVNHLLDLSLYKFSLETIIIGLVSNLVHIKLVLNYVIFVLVDIDVTGINTSIKFFSQKDFV